VAGRNNAQKLYADWNEQRHRRWQNSPAIRGVDAVRSNLTFDDPEKLRTPRRPSG
jgi:hypothetical protein